MIAIVPIVVMIAGLLMWALAGSPSAPPSPARPMVADIGRILFIIGAFVSVLVYSYVTVGDGPGPQRPAIQGR